MRRWLESHSSTLSLLSLLSLLSDNIKTDQTGAAPPHCCWAVNLLPTWGEEQISLNCSFSCLWLLSWGWGWVCGTSGGTYNSDRADRSNWYKWSGRAGWPNKTYLLWLAAIFVSPYLWPITVGWGIQWSELRPWPPLSRERILYWEQSHKYFTAEAEQSLNHKFLPVAASKGSCKLTLFLPIDRLAV